VLASIMAVSTGPGEIPRLCAYCLIDVVMDRGSWGMRRFMQVMYLSSIDCQGTKYAADVGISDCVPCNRYTVNDLF